ncbi:unnamed protein product [Phytophthora fragariaefolia]|uniref:Unnamed protein product n=1 Tax=Phytophthora fragariaefolia TaxID=1490495 RepID=A0A9W7D4H1_9STRA|nr:unnamed protein product [Phytophthora fragariaefolia]
MQAHWDSNHLVVVSRDGDTLSLDGFAHHSESILLQLSASDIQSLSSGRKSLSVALPHRVLVHDQSTSSAPIATTTRRGTSTSSTSKASATKATSTTTSSTSTTTSA